MYSSMFLLDEVTNITVLQVIIRFSSSGLAWASLPIISFVVLSRSSCSLLVPVVSRCPALAHLVVRCPRPCSTDLLLSALFPRTQRHSFASTSIAVWMKERREEVLWRDRVAGVPADVGKQASTCAIY